jgi:dTDP-4-dehydrorhamnose 3,5-epimerase
MNVQPLDIPDVKVLTPKKFGDHRGFFSEVFNTDLMQQAGIKETWIQDNHSHSVAVGVLRGLHYQVGDKAQAKLIRVVRGAILDVAVDIRRNSPTFGKIVTAEISAENWRQMYVPVGFAHGFVTIQPNTEVIYKVTNLYSPKDERGIRWNDPALNIPWGITADAAVLSDRDKIHPVLADQPDLY